MSIKINDIKKIIYFHKDNKTTNIDLQSNRIKLQNLLNLCDAHNGLRHVTVILSDKRKRKLGIRNARQLFTKGYVDY